METFRKCETCGMTFKDRVTGHGLADEGLPGTHWFCGNECLSRWNHAQKVRKERKHRGWRR